MCKKIRAWIRERRPWMFENHWLPGLLSSLPGVPISIWAISLGPFVFCKGEMSESTKQHETIHYHQQLELLFLGQWILYAIFWLQGLWKYRKYANRGAKAYRENPFEREAYDKESEEGYLDHRVLYSWMKYRY